LLYLHLKLFGLLVFFWLQLQASTNQEFNQEIPLFNLPSQILCRVANNHLLVLLFDSSCYIHVFMCFLLWKWWFVFIYLRILLIFLFLFVGWARNWWGLFLSFFDSRIRCKKMVLIRNWISNSFHNLLQEKYIPCWKMVIKMFLN
jgi:hypothetical protein